MIFDIENWLWKSIFCTLRQAGKASQDAYNPGKLLNVLALMKNWVAEGIASDVNDLFIYPNFLLWKSAIHLSSYHLMWNLLKNS